MASWQTKDNAHGASNSFDHIAAARQHGNYARLSTSLLTHTGVTRPPWVQSIIENKASPHLSLALQWRHNARDGVSNHQPHGCLLNRLFRRESKKTAKLRVAGLCAGNSPGIGEFPAQMASNAENVSIWWRHHDFTHNWSNRGTTWQQLQTYILGGLWYILDDDTWVLVIYNGRQLLIIANKHKTPRSPPCSQFVILFQARCKISKHNISKNDAKKILCYPCA